MQEHTNNLRKMALRGLLLLTVVICLFFFLLNINRQGLLPLAVIELFLAMAALLMLVLLKRANHNHQLRRLSIVFLLAFYGVMMYAFSQKEISTTVYVWLFLVPVLSYFLLGIRLGFIFTAVFSVSGMAFLTWQFNASGLNLNAGTLSNLFSCMLGIWVLSHVYEKAHKENREKLFHLALHDPLTGLRNRSALKSRFSQYRNQELMRLSLIIIDIDHFKLVNDRHGHEQGDKVLRRVAQLLKQEFETEGEVFRLGGEEFCVLLPEQPLSQAVLMAEHALSSCRNKNLSPDKGLSIKLTLSAGVAEQKNQNRSLSELLKLADNRLYKAKHNGRNQVVSQGGSNYLKAALQNEKS